MRVRRSVLAAAPLCAAVVPLLWTASFEPTMAATGHKMLTDFDLQVNRLLGQMTLDEKIGQMTQPDQQFLKNLDDIDKYHLGSLLSGAIQIQRLEMISN